MAHVGTTPNLGLPVWNGGDKPEMADFNDAFSKLDADGAAILSGTGDNWNRVFKFANGLMIIVWQQTYPAVITEAYGSIFHNAITRSFPQAFTERPFASVNVMSPGMVWTTMKAAGIQPNKIDFNLISPIAVSSALTVLEIGIAIGRWK